MSQNKKHSELIFEISWEVCNKVGGIYTVLSTKANTLCSLFQDQVIFIGPDFGKENTSSSFKESPRLLQKKSIAVIKLLRYKKSNFLGSHHFHHDEATPYNLVYFFNLLIKLSTCISDGL